MLKSGARVETRMQSRSWSSSLLFLIIAIGAEAGIANVWKFSYLAGANGGGLFVLLYLVALVLIAVPALMAEMMLGRSGGGSVVGGMSTLVHRYGISPRWKLFGVLAATSVVLILSYYCVICGWMLNYFVLSLRDGFDGINPQRSQATYEAMLANPGRMLLCSGLIIAATAGTVSGGINRGIERVSGVLTPLRFVILLLLLCYSIVFADVGTAARFLLSVDWSRLSAGVVVLAFGQAFFSLGIGVGVMMTMGAYMKREYSIAGAAITVALAQAMVALIAGLSIFPLVFRYGLQPAQGPGLIFVTLPVAFGRMPFGHAFGTLLFLLLSFAAVTATIVILETLVAVAEHSFRISRARLAWLTGAAIWLLGIPTVLSFNRWSDVHPLEWLGIGSKRTAFELLDYLTSNLLMPLGGLMVVLIAGWSLPRAVACQELCLGNGVRFRLWWGVTRYLVPAAIFVVFLSML